jgi:predicted small metal-binding protein
MLVSDLQQKSRERKCRMAKVLKCRDMGVQCDWVGRAKTEEELFRIAAEHASSAHGIKQIPKELLEKAKSVIRDEKSQDSL